MNSIESNFVPYQIALDMKSIGFDEPCFGFFYEDEELELCPVKNNNLLGYTNAPLYQQAFSFFREKYGCEFHIDCRRHTSVKYYEVFLFDGNNSSMVFGKSLKYEQAELELLNKLIEIVKNAKK